MAAMFPRTLPLMLALVPVLTTGGTLVQNVHATNGLQCIDVTQGVDATSVTVNPSDQIDCTAVSNNPESARVQIYVYGPSIDLILHQGPSNYSPSDPVTFSFRPAQSQSPLGVFTVIVNFYTQNNVELVHGTASFQVSFFVLPESPAGVAALTGSSLAALGAFVAYKRRKDAVPMP